MRLLTLLLLTTSTSALAAHTVKVERLVVEDLSVRQLDCTMDKVGLIGQVAVVGALSTQRDALNACAPEGSAVRMAWSWNDKGATSEVTVLAGGTPEQQACATKAVEKVTTAMQGRCQAIVLMGPLAPAEIQAQALIEAASPAPATPVVAPEAASTPAPATP